MNVLPLLARLFLLPLIFAYLSVDVPGGDLACVRPADPSPAALIHESPPVLPGIFPEVSNVVVVSLAKLAKPRGAGDRRGRGEDRTRGSHEKKPSPLRGYAARGAGSNSVVTRVRGPA